MSGEPLKPGCVVPSIVTAPVMSGSSDESVRDGIGHASGDESRAAAGVGRAAEACVGSHHAQIKFSERDGARGERLEKRGLRALPRGLCALAILSNSLRPLLVRKFGGLGGGCSGRLFRLLPCARAKILQPARAVNRHRSELFGLIRALRLLLSEDGEASRVNSGGGELRGGCLPFRFVVQDASSVRLL